MFVLSKIRFVVEKKERTKTISENRKERTQDNLRKSERLLSRQFFCNFILQLVLHTITITMSFVWTSFVSSHHHALVDDTHVSN